MILQEKQIRMRLDKGGEKRLAVISPPQPFCILNFLAVCTETDAIQATQKVSSNISKTRTIQSQEWILNPYCYLK